MVAGVRVYSPDALLPERARAWLEAADLQFDTCDSPAALARLPGADVADVVYVPPGRDLDAGRAAEMIEHSAASHFGILSAESGLVIHRAHRAALSLFYRPFEHQADAAVYAKGGSYRTDYGSGQVPLPRQVYLGLTQRCNRTCTFCVSRSFAYDLLSVAQVKRLCEELRGAVDFVALTGAGEAMMHPQFWDILDVLCERLPGIQFKMNTSGLALPRTARRLLGYPIKNITVSLNAATEPTYRRFVGPGFDAVLKGIETLVQARAELDRGDLHLCLSMVLMNSTIAETAQLATIAAELGIEEIQGIYLMINDDTLAAESPWHEPDRSNALLAQAARHAAALGVRASLPPAFQTGELRRDRDQSTSLPTMQGQRCTEAWSTVYVRPDGHIMSCPYMDRAMGSIRTQPLAEIWNGESYRDLRQGLVEQNHCQECRSCCGFNETGSVDEYQSHWLGERRPSEPIHPDRLWERR